MARSSLSALLLAFLTSTARAQTDVEAAKRYFEAGRQTYETGQYIPAITAFEESYKRAPRSAIVFSLAQAYRQQFFIDKDARKLKRAVELYRQYLAEVPQG